ncbi:MAG: hypothetical protein KME64_42075 [Scytonematopsis contorta HA4267-MV1]|jgi:hypothetical protein|nr:hypothetical protein [Scytonematopsis contorta HA4267-MV1]
MLDITKSPELKDEFATPSEKVKKHVKLTEINYRRNIESDYTEKIEELDKNFDYSSNSNHYWSQPELSLLYGTPLYEEASPSQKIALNHLYWATQYNQTAATEANTVLYNQVTAGVFGNVGGYDALCKELHLETEQERHHIHAFHTIGYKTKKALLGQAAFHASSQGKFYKNDLAKRAISGHKQLFSFNWQTSPLSAYGESVLRFATNKVLLRNQAHLYSDYLKQLDNKGESIPAQTTGLLGQLAPKPLLQFFTLNCGTSPFMACLFYVTRFMANMLIKNYEYRYSVYYRDLERNGEFIPAPVAVSHNHVLDEAFHTTTSQLIAQELYKDFSKPTEYEKFLANLTIYRAQVVGLSGLSGGLPAIFRTDASFILSFYKLLQSPVFNMSSEEALEWLKKCLCQEHEGFHVTLKYHERLLTDLRRLFDPIDYLWAVNRDMRVMAKGGSISKAIENNTKAFQQFSRSVT